MRSRVFPPAGTRSSPWWRRGSRPLRRRGGEGRWAAVLLGHSGGDRGGADAARLELGWNHTTLQALKADTGWTDLQVVYTQPFDMESVAGQLARYGEVFYLHHEMAREGGAVQRFAILLVRWRGWKAMYAMIEEVERLDGCRIFDPHVVTIEGGGMKAIDEAPVAFKRVVDPHGLMNPGKTEGWGPSMAKPWGSSPSLPVRAAGGCLRPTRPRCRTCARFCSSWPGTPPLGGFLLGPDLLVAPVLQAGAWSRSLFLPAGTDWVQAETGARHPDGGTVTVAAPLGRIPLFLRDGARVKGIFTGCRS